MAQKNNFGNDIILVKGTLYPDYESAWIYNPLEFDENKPIFAYDKNPEIRNKLIQAFPNRKMWVIEGPSLTGGQFLVVEKP